MVGLLEIMVQVHRQQFERNANVVPEQKIRFHLNKIEAIVLVGRL